VRRLVAESRQVANSCFWFTTLVSKKDTLPGVYRALKQAAAVDVQTIAMAQGQKKSRVVAWTFLEPAQQEVWRKARWSLIA
jgi:23S rRNA (adenine1618-N6)-methyltransferase